MAFVSSDPDGFAIDPIVTVEPLGPGLVGMIGGSDRGDEPGGVYEGVFSFGYWLHPGAWSFGFATEAAAAYLDHIARTRRPRRFEAGVFGWNPASGRVLEKLGFELEGRHRGRVERFGDVTDELVYGKLL